MAVTILVVWTAARTGVTSLCCTTPGLTTVAPGATNRTWDVATPGRICVWTVGAVVAMENTTFVGGGRMPSMVSSFVASACRNKGKLFWKEERYMQLKITKFTQQICLGKCLKCK